MFNQGNPLNHDDFRSKLKSYLGWVDETTYNSDRLTKLSGILGVNEAVLKQWTMGLARPSASTRKSSLRLGMMIIVSTPRCAAPVIAAWTIAMGT